MEMGVDRIHFNQWRIPERAMKYQDAKIDDTTRATSASGEATDAPKYSCWNTPKAIGTHLLSFPLTKITINMERCRDGPQVGGK